MILNTRITLLWVLPMMWVTITNHHLNDAFKKQNGITPSEYRQIHLSTSKHKPQQPELKYRVFNTGPRQKV